MAPESIQTSNDNPIEKLTTSVYLPFALLAGMQLDLFTTLKDGPMSAEQIAAAIEGDSTKLKALLYALVVAGFLNVKDGIFSNTDTANCFLVKGSTSSVVDIHEILSTMWNAALKTAKSIRTGLPQAKLNYSDMSQEELRKFFSGEHPYAVEYGRDLVKRYDFSSYRTLLDVGGGSGGLAIAVTESCPHIQATVVDLPNVIPVTQHYINEARAGDKVKVVTADVLRDPLPGSYDVAVMTAFIQCLPPDDACYAIKNVGKAINPGGDIYIRGYGIIDDSRISPQKLVGFNLVYINVYDDGQAYTEQEHKDWLEKSGFGGFKRTILEDGSSIINARKII
jgi:ubiquinone/menaquinone biosynthesis C-methylase UbiE